MKIEVILVALLAVATAVAMLARRVNLPYTVALVLTGLALGTSKALPVPHLTKDLLYAVFLPGLLFEAAFNLEFKKFWQNRVAIFVLAIPGVVLAIALTAGILRSELAGLHMLTDFGIGTALVFGGVIAASDPIAVVAMFKSLGAPKRLAILIEGESLLNDGTGVVIFTLILGAVTGGSFSATQGLLDFLRVAGMGVAIGTTFGYLASKLTGTLEDPLIEITITTIAAYGSFVAAEQFHFSGVIATVCAGLWCGNVGATEGMSASTRMAVHAFWDYIAFALNSVVFLLIGFLVRLDALLAAWKVILLAYIAVTVARAIVVFAVTAMLKRTSEKMPWSWAAILTWGGLRGGLSMVLALALPVSLPHRELLITMTFGVVVISILLQGLTMGPLLRRLKVITKVSGSDLELRGRVLAARAAMQALDRMQQSGAIHVRGATALRDNLQVEFDKADEDLANALSQATDVQRRELLRVEKQLLLARKDAVHKAAKEGVIDNDSAERLLAEFDARLLRVQDGDSELQGPAGSEAAVFAATLVSPEPDELEADKKPKSEQDA
ncbi:MAG: Na+/H+ antiporter [Deltaproteobacteria bacterium]|nr:Na+/H+ antiporter [Deltaproteobacteria bacterium]